MTINGLSLRSLVFALLLFGMAGLAAELLLQEHTESLEQWIPLVMLALGATSSTFLALRPAPARLSTFRIIMGLFVGTGLLGLYYHYAGNVEFALERDPGLRGIRLFWKALGGATPTLAPGALAQLGLLGLAYSHRHPAARGSDARGRDVIE